MDLEVLLDRTSGIQMKMIERLLRTSNDNDDQFEWFVLANLNAITFLNTTRSHAQLAWALLAFCTVRSNHHSMTTQEKEIRRRGQ